MLSPSAMERAEFSTALWITLFPAVFAVILKASIIGTPEETNGRYKALLQAGDIAAQVRELSGQPREEAP